METVNLEVDASQEQNRPTQSSRKRAPCINSRQAVSETSHDEPLLAPEDRHLLLGASLQLLGRRFRSGKAILRDDVIRVASLADDAIEWAS